MRQSPVCQRHATPGDTDVARATAPLQRHRLQLLPRPPQLLLDAPREPAESAAANSEFYRRAKRALDVVVSLIALAALAPLLLGIAAAIRLQDRGPALYRQERVGVDGRSFELLKFRSMVADSDRLRESVRAESDDPDALRFKARNDPRITALGRFLRRFSLDELPQLINVLRGEMTLVGPRPPIPEEVAAYGPWELLRLTVVPGLTCTWQVTGRSELSFEEQTRLDLEYIRRRSIAVDLGLLVRTIPAVIGGRGAW